MRQKTESGGKRGTFPRTSFLLISLAIGLLLLARAEPAAAQPPDSPLASFLSPDGTLKLEQGLSGSINVSGWRVALDPVRGPVFSQDRQTRQGSAGSSSNQTPQTDGEWSGLGSGVSWEVHAIAVSGSDVYVAGNFLYACLDQFCSTTMKVNNIAKWNGSTWSALANGVNGRVYALAVSGTDLIVGGDFQYACNTSDCDTRVNYVARWNGATWSAIGFGVSSTVYAIAISGSDIYIGGQFEARCGDITCTTGNVRVYRIARWNGIEWAALANGLNHWVLALAVNGSDVYAGGHFTNLCASGLCPNGPRVNYIAHWNGTLWSALDFGVDGPVLAIALRGSEVFVGGSFLEVCGNLDCDTNNTRVNHVARWDGDWSGLGFGLDKPGDATAGVSGLATNTNEVYAAGNFTHACGNVTCDNGNAQLNYVAQWDGESWSPLQYGFDKYVDTVVVAGSDLYAGGNFEKPCANLACTFGVVRFNRVAKFSPPPLCPTIPDTFTLKSPENNKSLSNRRPTFKWNAANCADTYKLTVKDLTTGNKVINQNGLTALQFKPSNNQKLTQGRDYKWWVQACNDSGCRTSNKKWKITIQ